MRSRETKHRLFALILATLGAAINFVLAAQVFSFSRALKWEADSEWEGAADGWRIDSVRLVWALLTAYFSISFVACLVGVAGVLRRTPSYVRLYRDYSVAEICFCGICTVFLALASFRPGARATVCEELARQPELLRDLAEAGLNPENCEQWFEHFVIAFVGLTAILLVVRLQFVITVSTYYKLLVRQSIYDSVELCNSDEALNLINGGSNNDDSALRRIFLLPSNPKGGLAQLSQNAMAVSTSSGSSTGRDNGSKGRAQGALLVYAPVTFDSFSEEDARELGASEAWVSRTHSRRHSHSHSHTRQHSTSHRHSHGHARSHSHSHSLGHIHGSGRISLPIRPDEGLLPSYSETTKA